MKMVLCRPCAEANALWIGHIPKIAGILGSCECCGLSAGRCFEVGVEYEFRNNIIKAPGMRALERIEELERRVAVLEGN